MEVLIQGLEFTNQLHLHLLQNKNNFLFGNQDFQESALDLTTKIHQSFTTALSLLNTCSANNSVDDGTSWDEVFIGDELSSNLVTTGISSDDHWKSSTDQYFGESKNYKAIAGSSTHDDDMKVGCKRRKSNSHTWVRVTPTPIDDGHAWRKYGQKEIYNTKFPRSYYRCTHRKEQGCQATKHVQKIQDKPSMFQTTYMGHHTCKEITSILDSIPDLMLDENDPTDHSSCVINFQTNLATSTQPFTFSSASFNTSVTEHEHNTTSHEQYITPSDHDLTVLLADLTVFDSIGREVLEVLDV